MFKLISGIRWVGIPGFHMVNKENHNRVLDLDKDISLLTVMLHKLVVLRFLLNSIFCSLGNK